MAGIARSWDLGAEDFESWRRLAAAWGGYAADLFSYHDFGFPLQDFLGHLRAIGGELVRAREESRFEGARFWPTDAARAAEFAATVRPWSAIKTLGYVTGGGFLLQRFRPGFPQAGVRTAFVANVLYNNIQGILDDLLDSGAYTLAEATELYQACLAPLSGGDFELTDLEDLLDMLVRGPSNGLVPRLCDAVRQLNGLVSRSPHVDVLGPELERMNDWLIRGQPLTAMQKGPHRDLAEVRLRSSSLWSPDAGIPWQERLGGHISWPLQLSLIDMAYADEPLSGPALAAHRDAWYYFHAVLANLNHLVAVREDLREGIVNVALLTLRERELLQGRPPESLVDLTLGDHETLFARTAELTRRALERAAVGYEDPHRFNASIAILVGVVAMAPKIGRDDEMIHGYMRWLAPVVREAVRGP